MRAQKITIAALALAAGLALTACQNDDNAMAQGGGSAASSGSSSNGGSTSGSNNSSAQGAAKGSVGKDSAGQATSGHNGSAKSGVAKCRTDDLDITANDATITGDENNTVNVTFTNKSGRSCTVAGFAGVDLKTNAGNVSAKRQGTADPAVVLKNGDHDTFYISYPVNDSGGSGVRITGLVVTPPDETKSVTLAWPGAASLPVTDGSGTSVKVGPMGSAGQGG
ncbi:MULTISPECIES: DUF4232 domain-containing protein [Streptomyces]|uniref:Glycine-rich secreted protein n=3 Tax=Streptomyces griseoaurantiacus TaxID=68213 RepID=F3NKJ8_9ACTN|nr:MULTISPECIES: DUF4232 domain-containing protein [Streptomyces]EGG46157.1 glycine-rich secreted protein [Streptomyces griseoaurantiacus M045]MBA5224208.1 DUF4232 domain-containing protein [Streptomyces griseoaurantiacus]MDX3087238.1 DUF4232 domain-containing protein [Streptomyces sp. ME12-02E]MDX3334334.1 DUF4232 domain-containing protein [Streptomyces sp. ME02-6978a]MDX3362298.1 DUF4232 domain-containing protein [Streptomyces sp. ME02-6978.2a]